MNLPTCSGQCTGAGWQEDSGKILTRTFAFSHTAPQEHFRRKAQSSVHVRKQQTELNNQTKLKILILNYTWCSFPAITQHVTPSEAEPWAPWSSQCSRRKPSLCTFSLLHNYNKSLPPVLSLSPFLPSLLSPFLLPFLTFLPVIIPLLFWQLRRDDRREGRETRDGRYQGEKEEAERISTISCGDFLLRLL